MRFTKLLLLILALFIATASSALADNFYEVSIDTSSLNASDGYLYFQYVPFNGADSTAIVSHYVGGLLASARSSEVDGSAVTGLLPGTVSFANTNGINDYNQGINFGDSIFFRLLFGNLAPGGQIGGGSTFSLGLFQDELGATPLLTSDGTLFAVNLMNDGTPSASVFSDYATLHYVPEPSTLWLFGPGLLGVWAMRRRIIK